MYVDVECMLDVVNIDTVMQEKFQTCLTIKYKSKVNVLLQKWAKCSNNMVITQ